MKRAYIFPGQGVQTPGMGRELSAGNPRAAQLFAEADALLGFKITEIMFHGSADDLKKTSVTQPAVFLDSVIPALCLEDFRPDMVAGHSLGEFSALVACGALSFEDGLRLVSARAAAMQKCCEAAEGGMAAIIGLEDETVREICALLREDGHKIVASNFNAPGQVVISGPASDMPVACAAFRERGARRALPLSVDGAFHSPLMEPARRELSEAVGSVEFHTPVCPVYQNVDALPHLAPDEIKANLLLQLTSPVLWTGTVLNMLRDGAGEFIECGPGRTLTGMVERIRKI